MASNSEYTISVVVDSDASGLDSGAQQAADAIEGLQASAESAGSGIDSAMSSAGDSFGGVSDAAGSAGDSLTGLADTAAAAATDTSDALSGIADSADTAATSAVSSLGDIPDAASSAAGGIDDAVSSMGDALGSLSDVADSVAQDISDTFSTDVPASVDSAAVNLTTKVGKFKAVGSTLGTELAAGVAGGVGGQEAALNIGTSLTNLIAVSSKSLQGIGAAVGIGLAVSLVKNWIDGTNAKKQEIIDAYNEIFTSVEVSASDTAQTIRDKILDAFTFEKVVTDFGGGDINKGIEGLQQIADSAGIARSDIGLIVEYLQRGVTPETAEVARKIRGIADDTEQWSGAVGSVGRNQGVVAQRYTEVARLAQQAREEAHANNEEQEHLNQQKRVELQFTKETSTWAERHVIAAEKLTANTRAAAEAQRDHNVQLAIAAQRAEDFADKLSDAAAAAYAIAGNIGDASSTLFRYLD